MSHHNCLCATVASFQLSSQSNDEIALEDFGMISLHIIRQMLSDRLSSYCVIKHYHNQHKKLWLSCVWSLVATWTPCFASLSDNT